VIWVKWLRVWVWVLVFAYLHMYTHMHTFKKIAQSNIEDVHLKKKVNGA